MKFISLFAGIGGFDLGFQRAGIETDSVCEIDKDCQNILSRHFPNTTLYDDVRKVGKKTHGRKSIDLICGGFPCQDLSVAGKRAGLAGERSGLWFEFARVIDELEPGWVVIENVPGLLSSNGGKDFAVILRWLAERGYGVAWRILDAQYFGVPQRRRRVFIVASFGSGRCAEILFERESMSGNTSPSREAGKEVAYSLRSNPSHSGDKGDGGVNTTMVSVFGGGNTSGPIEVATARNTKGDTRLDFDTETFITYNIQHNDGGEHRRKDRPNGGLYVNETDTALTVGTTDLTAVAYNWQNGGDVRHGFGKPTLQANQVPAVGIRRLTPVECERLQGFPDGWTAGQADTVRYRQLGNAVAVPVIEWIGRRIIQP